MAPGYTIAPVAWHPDDVAQSERSDQAWGPSLARFARRYRQGALLASDQAVAEELTQEARPVLEALRFALQDRSQGSPWEGAGGREGLAMLTLLARRAGALGISPTASLAIVPALVEALEGSGEVVASGLVDALQMAAMEGYVAGREERLCRKASERAAQALAWAQLAPRCLAAFWAGTQPPRALLRAGEDLGRELLRRDAVACLLDISGLREPSAGRARAVLSVVHAGATLGVRCWLVGFDDVWRATLPPRVLEGVDVRWAPSVERALPDVLDVARERRVRGSWRALRARVRRLAGVG